MFLRFDSFILLHLIPFKNRSVCLVLSASLARSTLLVLSIDMARSCDLVLSASMARSKTVVLSLTLARFYYIGQLGGAL